MCMIFCFTIHLLTLELRNPTNHTEKNKSENNNDIHKNNAVTHLIDGSKENVEEQFLSNYYTPESKKMEE